MATLKIDELVKAVEQLPENDLETLATEVLALKAKRVASNLSEDEAFLLKKINQGMSDDLQQRYQLLVARRNAETLTDEEHVELCQLTERMEQHQADRLRFLVQLANVRGVPLPTILEDLGIQASYT